MNRKRAALARSALHRHAPAVALDDVFDQRQAQSGPRNSSVVIFRRAIEALEDAFMIARMDADAEVAHLNHRFAAAPFRAQLDSSFFARILDRVVKQVQHGLFERITGNVAVHNLLDGVTAAVVGIMAATTVGLVRSGITDVPSACIAAVGLVMLWFWRSRAAVPVTVLAGGLLGLAVLR